MEVNDPRSSWRPEPSEEYSERLARAFSSLAEGQDAGGADGESGEILKGGLASGHAAYRLRKAVAEGGHGEIWEAVQVSLNRVVAIKRVRKELRESGHEPVELDNPWWRENGAMAFADPDNWRIVLMPKPIPLAA